MAKLTSQQNSGHRGEAWVQKVVVDAGMIYTVPTPDFGFDGQIDFVDSDGVVTGAQVLVQVKATTSPSVDAHGVVTFLCNADWIDLVLRLGRPVVLVLADLTGERLLYKRVDAWFRDPERRQRRSVSFSSEFDVFDEHAVCNLVAEALPAGVELPRFGAGETLLTNMLEVTAFGPYLYSAPTSCDRSAAWERMSANGSFEGGFHITDGRVWSLDPIDGGPLAVLCDEPVTAVASSEWSRSGDPIVQRRFAALLNFTLRAMHHPHLVWHPGKRVVYFLAPRHLKQVKVKGRSARSRGVSFVTPYSGTDAANQVRYWRHNAADLRFRRWADDWVLEINPTYHYTMDGRRDSLFDSEYLSKIKRLERNKAVRNSVQAWADLLSRRTGETLFGPGDERIVFRDLLTVDVDVSIMEELWLPQPAAEPATGMSLGLWGQS